VISLKMAAGRPFYLNIINARKCPKSKKMGEDKRPAILNVFFLLKM